jgi:hypothetical protein
VPHPSHYIGRFDKIIGRVDKKYKNERENMKPQRRLVTSVMAASDPAAASSAAASSVAASSSSSSSSAAAAAAVAAVAATAAQHSNTGSANGALVNTARMAAGWVEKKSRSTGKVYGTSTDTGKSTWDFPQDTNVESATADDKETHFPG